MFTENRRMFQHGLLGDAARRDARVWRIEFLGTPHAWLLAIGLLGGCDSPQESLTRKSEPSTTRPGFWDEPTTPTKPQRVVNLAPPAPKAVAAIAPVKLSAADEATCKLRVGDTFPESPLVPRGKATLVAFVPPSSKPIDTLIAEEMLETIPATLAKAGGSESVRFVALDAAKGETLLAEVAQNAKPPRLFLLDTAGTILWFDIEFSVATRDAIEQAVRFVVAGTAAPTPTP